MLSICKNSLVQLTLYVMYDLQNAFVSIIEQELASKALNKLTWTHQLIGKIQWHLFESNFTTDTPTTIL